MYEQVSRRIQLIRFLVASLKPISFVTFVVAVDGVGSNFNHHFSSSIYVVVDTKLFDPSLSINDFYLILWILFLVKSAPIWISISHLQSTLLSTQIIWSYLAHVRPSVCCYQRISIPIILSMENYLSSILWILLWICYYLVDCGCYFISSWASKVLLERRLALCPIEIVVFYPHSTINILLFDQGSAIFDFKQLYMWRKGTLELNEDKTGLNSWQTPY